MKKEFAPYKQQFDVADIDCSRSGILIDAKSVGMLGRHYNVVVTKVEGEYRVEAERPGHDFFTYPEYDPKIVETVIDKHVQVTKPSIIGWVFGSNKKFVRGWCELKKREKVAFTAKNLTIRK